MITTGGEGKVQARKRVRGKIGNYNNSPEIKMHNLWVEGTDTNQTYYNNKNIIGNFTQEDRSSVWWPLRTYWPQVGNTQWNRVGRKIKVKFLRVKGFVYYSPYLITQVRFRIVLYRTKITGTLNHTQWLGSLYNCFNPLTDAGDVDSMAGRCAFNYYLSWFNNDKLKEYDCKRRVLYKGMLKPQPDIGNFYNSAHNIPSTIGAQNCILTTDTYGKVFGAILNNADPPVITGAFNGLASAALASSTNYSTGSSTLVNDIPVGTSVPARTFFGQYQKHFTTAQGASYDAVTPGNQRGFFPIDITVDMHDNIDCEEYFYVFVVESDWCIGQDPLGEFSYAKSKTNFGLVICPQIFFTDD